jgi:hypothetical protein
VKGTLDPPKKDDDEKVPRLPPPTIEINSSLDPNRVIRGGKIRITEMTPIENDVAVFSVSHHLYLVAQYDIASGELRNLAPVDYRKCDPKVVFDGLPHDRVVFGGWEFNSLNPREKGFEFEFTASRIGVFNLIAEWSIRGSTKRIQSQPIILTVTPPRDDKGKLIIKREWLID